MFYIFNKETLLPQKVNFKPLLILPVVISLAVVFNWFYFSAEIFEITDYKGKVEKVTLQEKIADYQRINSYK